MSCDCDQIECCAKEDIATDFFGRACAQEGTGAVSPIPDEGNLLKIADVSTINYKAYASDGTLNHSFNLVVATTIYDTLQTGGTWDKVPGVGGNIQFIAPADCFPAGGDIVTLEPTITLADGRVIAGASFIVTVKERRQS